MEWYEDNYDSIYIPDILYIRYDSYVMCLYSQPMHGLRHTKWNPTNGVTYQSCIWREVCMFHLYFLCNKSMNHCVLNARKVKRYVFNVQSKGCYNANTKGWNLRVLMDGIQE